MKKGLIFLLLFMTYLSMIAEKADLIVFSFDRPLQLYAFLESAELYLKNVGEIHVIYRSSNERFSKAYDEVIQRFSYVGFLKQGERPQGDFKPLVLKSLSSTPNECVLFAVDDIVIKDYVDIDQCIACLKKNNAYGFFLRLGKNITYSYMHNKPQSVPVLKEVESGIYAWSFSGAHYDWGYPHTVDMTVYRKKDIKNDFETMDYYAPNALEGRWSQRVQKLQNDVGLCYEQSKIVNIPLNKVQRVFVHNRAMNICTPLELLEIFEAGKKMDIIPLCSMPNVSAHIEYTPTFIDR